MTSRPKIARTVALERYRIALVNVADEPKIAENMAKLGYDAKMIQKGQDLFDKTRAVYDLSQKYYKIKSAVYAKFIEQKKKLDKIYRLHRKLAKIIFRKDPSMTEKLSISTKIPQSYTAWLETINKFYNVALKDPKILKKFSKVNISKSMLEDMSLEIEKINDARAAYIYEKGNSQNKTDEKTAAFAKLDIWMSSFYSIARIAMADQPQLLESIGVYLKS